MSTDQTGDRDGIGDLFDELEELESIVDSDEERQQVRSVMRAATEAQDSDTAVFGRVIWGFDREDIAESILGSLLFGIPMAVEGGTVDAGLHIARHPLYFAGTLATAVAMVVGILYVADFQDVRIAHRIFGFIPRRLAGVTLTALGTSVALLTGWGLVDWSSELWLVWESLCICAVAFVPMAIGAALGDILPGS